MTQARRRMPADERRDSIVAAASHLFAQRPYAQVSTVEIARAAGVARGLLNHYFGDKRGLYLEVVRRSVLLPELEQLSPDRAPGPLPTRIDAAVHWFLDSVDAQATTHFAVAGSEAVADDPEVAAIVDEGTDLAARHVLRLIGLDPTDELAMAHVRCYAGLVRATLREWSVRGTLTRPQAHSLLRDVLLVLTEGTLLAPPSR